MTDGRESTVVEGALNDCAEEFERGVHSFHGSSGDSDLTIAPGVVDALKDLLRDTFSEQLDPEADRTGERRDWDADKTVILPVAFYTGALAALYAQPRDAGKLVTNERAVEALKHVSGYCHGPMNEDPDTSDDVRVRWRYCPTWPAARAATEDDAIRAIESSAVGSRPGTDLKRGKKTVTVGCVDIPLPFLNLRVCVDLRFSW